VDIAAEAPLALCVSSIALIPTPVLKSTNKPNTAQNMGINMIKQILKLFNKIAPTRERYVGLSVMIPFVLSLNCFAS
jgi:hypothetical protein